MAQSLEQITDAHLISQEQRLAQLEAAKTAIERATTIDEANEYRNQAEVLEVYYLRVESSTILADRCNEIKLRAERKIGEMLRQLDLSPGPSNGQSLGDMDISRNQSSKWQRLATIPDETWEEAIQEGPSEAALLRLAKALEKAQEEPPAPEPIIDHEPTPNQPITQGYWVLAEGEGLTKVSDAAGVPVVALLDGDGVVAGYFLDHALAEQVATILNAM